MYRTNEYYNSSFNVAAMSEGGGREGGRMKEGEREGGRKGYHHIASHLMSMSLTETAMVVVGEGG